MKKTMESVFNNCNSSSSCVNLCVAGTASKDNKETAELKKIDLS